LLQTIDGKHYAKNLLSSVEKKIKSHLQEGRRCPCLAVVLVGDDQASRIYVSRKIKTCEKVGICSKSFYLKHSATQEEVLELISSLNNDQKIDAILVQLPLPKHLDEREILEKISFVKDVDGLTTANQGSLFINNPKHIPCTPQGVMHLLEQTPISISGKVACVIGRSILVGSPIARLLLQANASVIQIHSKTLEPKRLCLLADIVVVACGRARFIDDTWIKKDAVVIDVGIHRTEDGLCGDVDFEKVAQRAKYLTPVPGGVGPMTIACLLKNTLQAYEMQINL
jgi:methylenetetrahydrofolate dehydrogenase (NADP+) / methenyltetrahydrofolate cyclohydrolase